MAPDRRGFPRTQRLTRERELEEVRRRGGRFRTTHLEVRHMTSLLPYARAGVVVPRYSRGAVERNRVKRRLKEIVRLDVLPFLRGVDVVVRALPSAYVATYSDLREQCRRACEQLGNTTA